MNDLPPKPKTIKLLLIGDSGVGKTSLLLRYSDGTFDKDTYITLQCEYKEKMVNFEEQDFKIELWDTAGQERFRMIAKSPYRGMKCIMIVYDITDRESFENARKWYGELERYTNLNSTVVSLIANKIDLQDIGKERVVSSEEGLLLANELGLKYFETSAKYDINVNTAFIDIINDHYLSLNQDSIYKPTPPSPYKPKKDKCILN